MKIIPRRTSCPQKSVGEKKKGFEILELFHFNAQKKKKKALGLWLEAPSVEIQFSLY